MSEAFEGEYVPETPEPLWMKYPLRDKKGQPIDCMHSGCHRYAVRTLSSESVPGHSIQQTHDCCSVHSKGPIPGRDG